MNDEETLNHHPDEPVETCEGEDNVSYDERQDKKIKSARIWGVDGQGDYFGINQSSKFLPPGQYSVKVKQGEFFLSLNKVNIDDILYLPDSSSDEVIRNIETFWKNEDLFREYGFLWKRGILLHGPPGGGKTCTVQLISKKIVDMGGVTVYIQDPDLADRGLKMLRKIEPERNLVVILEDIDAMMEMHGESEILSLLDGELQIDNVVFLATTNYIEKLDKRIRNRPSRFDFVKEIGMPTREARAIFLKSKGLEGDQLERWLDLTDDFSIAHLKEMIVSVLIMGHGLEETVERLTTMITDNPSSEDYDGTRSGGFGFTGRPKRNRLNKAPPEERDY